MKVSIEGHDYELTDECISGLLADLKKVLVLANAKLPPEIQAAIEGVTSLSDESLTQLVNTVKDFGLGYYTGLSTPKRLGVMAGARWLITQAEKKFGEVARVLRPPKRADPVEHAVSVVYPIVQKQIPVVGKALPYVTIALTTDNKNITNIRFSIEGQGG